MALETADHIAGLVITNPPGGDPLGQADDHLVLIKKVLKADLGGIASPVYEDADAAGAGGTTLATGVTMSSWEARIKAAEDAIIGASGFQVGMIMMWSGAIVDIPAKWGLCDGITVGSPDLRGQFIVGAGDTYAPDDTGGSDTATTDGGTAHTHALTVAGHTLVEAEIPEHNHAMFTGTQASSSSTPLSGAVPTAVYTTGGLDQAYVMRTSAGTPVDGITGDAGSDGAHGHPGSTAANEDAHTHSVIDNKPPYYALAYIMFTGV